MWVDERVEARVEFQQGLAFPCLRAIRYQDQVVQFDGLVRVDCTPTALLYRTEDADREYCLRFEAANQRWVLETIRPSRR